MSCDPQPPENSGDIYNERQTSYLRTDGLNNMGAPLSLVDGMQECPGLTFTNDPRSGFWRTAQAVCLSVHAVVGLHCWYENAYGFLVGGVEGKFTHANTAERTWTFPDSDGTVALVETRAAGLTAESSQTQGDGPLTAVVNEISTCATANDSRTLPAATGVEKRIVINNGAEVLQIFPISGDQIDGNAVDASVTIASGGSGQFISYASGKWHQF